MVKARLDKETESACHEGPWPAYCVACKGKFMADVANKYPDNVPGKYYVDNQCIDCDLCRETAPNNFKRNDDGGYSFVFKQPGTPDEEARARKPRKAARSKPLATTAERGQHTFSAGRTAAGAVRFSNSPGAGLQLSRQFRTALSKVCGSYGFGRKFTPCITSESFLSTSAL